MEKYSMTEMTEMVNAFESFVDKFNTFKANQSTKDDDYDILRNLVRKYSEKVFNAVMDNDKLYIFDKNFPIIGDSTVDKLRIDSITNYLYVTLGNGETMIETDLHVEDWMEISSCIDLNKEDNPKHTSKSYKEILKDDFITLVKRYGETYQGVPELHTFDYECELDGSTIDKIQVNPITNDVLFFFNENTNDYAMFESFTNSGLAFFFDDLTSAIEEESDEIEEKYC